MPIEQPKRNVLMGSLPDIHLSTGHIDNTLALGRMVGDISSKIEAMSAENLYIRSQKTLSSEINRLSALHQNNPEKLAAALDDFGTSFIGEIGDYEVRTKLQGQWETGGQAAIERARAGRDKIITEQHQYETFGALDSLSQEAAGMAPDLFSTDEGVRISAIRNAQSMLLRAQELSSQTGPDGMPLLSPQQKLSAVSGVKDMMLESATIGWFNNQQDKVRALEDFKAGKLKLSLPDYKGNFVDVDVAANLRPAVANMIHQEAKRQIAEQKAVAAERQRQVESNMDFAVEMTDDPKSLIDLSTRYENMRGNISEGAYKRGMIKINKRLDGYRKEVESLSRGSVFASGEEAVNRFDTQSVNDFNNYYDKVISQKVSSLDPPQKNLVLSEIVSNAGIIPKRLEGDIYLASQSRDPEKVRVASDLINRIENKNPDIAAELNSKHTARLSMVRKLLDAGYEGKDAFDRADSMLTPQNKAITDERMTYVNSQKVDYASKALSAVQGLHIPFMGVDVGPESISASEAAQMSIDYSRAYKSQYILTGDEDLAEEHANRMVKSMYSVSNVNGQKQIMKWAPEKYYGIRGEDNEWMRRQLIEVAKDSIKSSAFSQPIDPEKDVYIMIDPYMTPRTAAEGQPVYKIMARSKETGLPIDILGGGKYFYFDKNKRDKELVERAKNANR